LNIEEPFFFYSDNFLNKQEIDEIEKFIMYSQPFFLNPAEITTQEQSAVYVLGDMFSDYPFLVSGNNSFSPEGPILKICYSILSKLNIFNILGPVRVVRSKSNLTSRTTELRLGWPHIDNDQKHFVVIYYVNDSDGDTVIYNEKYSGKVYDQSELTIFKTISPKAGSIIIFDGRMYHTNYAPQKNNFRCVINMNLKQLSEVNQ
jgi:hypothetical protein